MAARETKTGRRSERLRRKQVAERLQLSTSSVRRLEGTRLYPKQDERGVWWFDPVEIEAVAREGSVRQRKASVRTRSARSVGDVAARVFRMFEQEKDLPEIVMTLRLPPEQVRELYQQWLVGLSDGEWKRQEKAAYERERREKIEDDRAQAELIRAIRS